MHVIRVSLKYFTLGLVAGLLIAPRAGRETRGRLIDQFSSRMREVLAASQ